MNTTPHKHHSTVFILLICCLALLLALVGIVVTLQLTPNQADPSPIVTEEDQAEEVETVLFNGLYGRVPTFEYPHGWHIAYSTNVEKTSVRIEPGPIEEETEVGPGISTISISRAQLPTLEDGEGTYADDIIARYESSSVTQEVASKTTEQLDNGTLTNFVIIRSPHGDPLEFEFVLFETETDYILISFINVGEEAEEGWQIIKDSLDFSSVEVIDYSIFAE